jgi:hypothetical protein
LSGFQQLSNSIDLEPEDVLVRGVDNGLDFVETGLLRVQWSAENTTRNGTLESTMVCWEYDKKHCKSGTDWALLWGLSCFYRQRDLAT